MTRLGRRSMASLDDDHHYDTLEEKHDYELPPHRLSLAPRKETPPVTTAAAQDDAELFAPNGAHNTNAGTAAGPPLALVRRSPMEQIRELVTYLADLKTVCEALCKATVLPPLMQNPANLQLVIAQGLSMGFTVWQAIRASFIIPPKNDNEVPRVGYYVEALVALVRQSDKCRFFRIEEATSKMHRVVCARTDEAETVVHVFELSREEASRSGMDKSRWKDRNGQWQEGIKFNWQANEADMLNARNCGRAVKRTFQDVVFGMATPEELDDIIVASQQESEVFAAIPRAAQNAKRVVVDSMPDDSVSFVTHTVKEASEPHVVPAGDATDPMRSDVAPAVMEGSGDPAWDAVLLDIGRFAGVDTTGWLPSDLLELWRERLAKCESKGTLTLVSHWMPTVASRMHESKSCSEVFAKMREMFNSRDREIKAADRAAKAAGAQ